MTRLVLLALFVGPLNLPTNAANAPCLATPAGLQSPSEPATSTSAQPTAAAAKREIAITCDYETSPPGTEKGGDEPQIAIIHAALSFKTNTENWLRAKFTFANAGTTRISETRSVYLAIDDDSGHNFVRRVLPSVDFRSLAPGQQHVFSERLLIPALQPGHYKIELWIPSPDPALKFNRAHNLLLDNPSVADRKSGLNTLAAFDVVR